jgi:Domain of unknown function (DUF5624)
MAETYTCPRPFLDLYHDFSGANDPDFKGTITIGNLLSEATAFRERADAEGPLVIVTGTGVFVYDDETRELVTSANFRASRSTGFFEMTSVSHIGAAVPYLARIKALGDERWETSFQSLLHNMRAVQSFNAATTDHWLDRLNMKAWQTFRDPIRQMVDYACRMGIAYLENVMGGAEFTPESVQRDFLEAQTTDFPVPFNNVMIGTFAAEALQGIYSIYQAFSPHPIAWSRAKVLIRSLAGTNYSAALTKDTCWYPLLLTLLSGGELPEDRVIFAPYADMRAGVGEEQLSVDDYSYYSRGVWYRLYSQTKLAREVFSSIGNIHIPDRPALPGDWSITSPNDIDHFLMRLKHSLADNRELLSNTIGFWIAEELARKRWDPSAVDLPGLTHGFPDGVEGYPHVTA